MRDREGLIARIRQLRRTADAAAESTDAVTSASEHDEIRVLQARIEHLEKLVLGLQDSVHRESSRQAKRIAELEARIQPGVLGKTLSDDARARGL